MPSEHGTGGGRGADRWVGFADWLRWHAGGSVGEATAADQDEPQGQQQSVPAGAPPLEVPEAGSSAAQATVPAAPENPTEGFRLDTREIPNCRCAEFSCRVVKAVSPVAAITRCAIKRKL